MQKQAVQTVKTNTSSALSPNDDPDSNIWRKNRLTQNFEELKAAVFKKRPVLKQIVETHGSKSLFEYAKTYYESQSGLNTERKNQVITTITNETKRILGEEVAASVGHQLQNFYHASTADHLGPVVHPWLLNANLLLATPIMEQHADAKNVIVLAGSTVSLNNPSFPRGILFNSELSGDTQKIPFYPKYAKPCVVSHMKPFDTEQIERARNLLKSKRDTNQITKEETKLVDALVQEIYLNSDVLSQNSYPDQISLSNFMLWKKYFPANTAPNLIYLSLEKIVASLLLEYHLGKNTLIDKILFHQPTQELLSVFEGMDGAHSETNGTFLFWAVPEGTSHRLALKQENGKLVSYEHGYEVELTPDAIRAALSSGDLVPSNLLNFLVLSCYHGLTCLGGFSQVNYLTEYKRGYLKLAELAGDQESVAVAENVITDKLIDVMIAFFERENVTVPATGIDWLIKGNATTWGTFVEQCKNITLEETLYASMADFYKFAVPESERSWELSAVATSDILKLIGLDKKTKSCVTVIKEIPTRLHLSHSDLNPKTPIQHPVFSS